MTAEPGLIGALLVGVSAAKALAWSRRLPLIPVNHLHGHVASLYLEPLDLEPPFTCLLASGGHTMLLDVQDAAATACSERRSTTRPARRSTRAPGCSGSAIPAGAEIDALARHGDPERIRVPGRAASRVSTSRSPASRRRSSTPCASSRPDELEARRADLAASYQRAIVRALVERVRASGAARVAVVGGVAANSELRAALPGRRARPARALHRQRSDDRLRRPLREPVPYPEYLSLDARART